MYMYHSLVFSQVNLSLAEVLMWCYADVKCLLPIPTAMSRWLREYINFLVHTIYAVVHIKGVIYFHVIRVPERYQSRLSLRKFLPHTFWSIKFWSRAAVLSRLWILCAENTDDFNFLIKFHRKSSSQRVRDKYLWHPEYHCYSQFYFLLISAGFQMLFVFTDTSLYLLSHLSHISHFKYLAF